MLLLNTNVIKKGSKLGADTGGGSTGPPFVSLRL